MPKLFVVIVLISALLTFCVHRAAASESVALKPVGSLGDTFGGKLIELSGTVFATNSAWQRTVVEDGFFEKWPVFVNLTTGADVAGVGPVKLKEGICSSRPDIEKCFATAEGNPVFQMFAATRALNAAKVNEAAATYRQATPACLEQLPANCTHALSQNISVLELTLSAERFLLKGLDFDATAESPCRTFYTTGTRGMETQDLDRWESSGFDAEVYHTYFCEGAELKAARDRALATADGVLEKVRALNKLCDALPALPPVWVPIELDKGFFDSTLHILLVVAGAFVLFVVYIVFDERRKKRAARRRERLLLNDNLYA
jgi:hypothetical protein